MKGFDFVCCVDFYFCVLFFFVWQHVSSAIGADSKSVNNRMYVSAEELQIQVDELYENFNKLAESLNITKIESKSGNFELLKVSFYFL